MLCLFNDFSRLAGIKLCWFSIFNNRYPPYPARELVRNQFNSHRADGTNYPAPVRIAPVYRAFNQRIIGNSPTRLCRIGLCCRTIDYDLEHTRRTFGVESHLSGQVVTQFAQRHFELLIPRTFADNRPITRKAGS